MRCLEIGSEGRKKEIDVRLSVRLGGKACVKSVAVNCILRSYFLAMLLNQLSMYAIAGNSIFEATPNVPVPS